MSSNNEYAKMTIDELAAEKEKVKSQRTLNIVLSVIAVGFAIYAATHHKGFIITVVMLIFPFRIWRANAKNEQAIQEELERRG